MKRLRVFRIGFIFLIPVALVHGQFRLDIEAVANPVETDTTETPVVIDRFAARNLAVIRNIEGLVFGRLGTPSAARQRIEEELEKWIDRLNSAHTLTLEQRSKLWLAGRQDIESLFRETQEIEATTFQDFAGVVERVNSLRSRIQKGVCADGSILSRVAKRVVSQEGQRSQHVVAEDRTEFSNRTAIKVAISEIERMMPLTSVQREKLVEFLAESKELRRRPTKCNVLGALSAMNRNPDDMASILTKQQLADLKAVTQSATKLMVTSIKLEPVDWQ